MMMKWLGTEILGLTRGRWLLIGLALAVIAWQLGAALIGRTIDTARDAGAAAQREANLTETVQNVEKANAAAETVVRDPAAARADCLRNARNPANC